jgi:hypothetical protein
MKAKPAERICKRCGSRFISEPIQDWEYNERGDDRPAGYYYSRVCQKCHEHENNLPRGSREYGQILYDEGLITLADFIKNYNGKEGKK